MVQNRKSGSIWITHKEIFGLGFPCVCPSCPPLPFSLRSEKITAACRVGKGWFYCCIVYGNIQTPYPFLFKLVFFDFLSFFSLNGIHYFLNHWNLLLLFVMFMLFSSFVIILYCLSCSCYSAVDKTYDVVIIVFFFSVLIDTCLSSSSSSSCFCSFCCVFIKWNLKASFAVIYRNWIQVLLHLKLHLDILNHFMLLWRFLEHFLFPSVFLFSFFFFSSFYEGCKWVDSGPGPTPGTETIKE